MKPVSGESLIREVDQLAEKIQEKKDGILTVTARISHEMEIFPLILQWLPEIKLVSPETLRLKLKEKMLQVRSYLKTEFDI